MEQGVVNWLQAGLDIMGRVFSDIHVLLTTSPDQFANGLPWEIVTNINTALQGFGYGLLIMFFLMSFFRTTTNFKEINLWMVTGWIIRFILVKVLIDYSTSILNFLINISLGANQIIYDTAGTLAFSPEVPQEVLDAVQAVEAGDFLTRFGAFFQTIPMFVMGLIANTVIVISGMIMVVVTYMRFFKVFIYSAIAPLPLSTFGSPDTSSMGKQFLKSYAAVCLEICVISLACVIFTAIVNGGGTQIWESWNDIQFDMVNPVNGDFWGITMNFIFVVMIQCVILTMSVQQANRIIREAFGV